MRNIKIGFLKAGNILLSALIALLGFHSACSPGGDEYGTPYAEFKLSGKTEAANTGQAIENIRVIAEGDSSYTDANGRYEKNIITFGAQDGELLLKFEDIDGSDNGAFESLDTLIQYKASDFEGGDGSWYNGEASKTVNVKLQPKK